jgi:hypothetical protein
MEISPSLFSKYLRSNVLPTTRVRPSAGGRFLTRAGTLTYSPASVDPLQASGGFNSVVELSAARCRQQAARAIFPVPLERSISVDALTSMLKDAPPGGSLASLLRPTMGLTDPDSLGFRLTLALAGLTFADQETIVLSFSVSLWFVSQATSPQEIPTGTVNQFPDLTRLMQSGGTAAIPAFTAVSEVGPTLPGLNRMGPGALSASAAGGNSSQMLPTGQPVLDDSVSRTRFIGSFGAELRAPMIHRDEATRCQTRVFVNLRLAKWSESLPPRPAAGQPSNDILLVHDASFSNWTAGATALLQAPLDLPITPTLSLVGPNPGSISVTEITNFDVRAFAVFDASGFAPALAVAFDVMPGCHGIIEDVRHFIGPNPYGLVSDEFVVDSVFRHRWNQGGFDRRIELQVPVKATVSRNGNVQLEDATLFGHQDLLTLDFTSLTTNSNTRTDCIFFGGLAQSVPTSVRLIADGQTFDASQVDLGPAQLTHWGVGGIVDVNATPAADPEIQDFQLKAQRDGGQPIGYPFAFVPSSNPLTYARIDGISRYVMFLGNLPANLD